MDMPFTLNFRQRKVCNLAALCLLMVCCLPACPAMAQQDSLPADTAGSTTLETSADSAAKAPSGVSVQARQVIIQVDSSQSLLDSLREQRAARAEKEPESITEPPSLEGIFLWKIFWSILVFGMGYFLIRTLTKLLELISERSTGYRITIKGLVPVIRIVGWIFVIFIIVAGVIRPEIEAVLALTASVGVAVGFASQDILKNIFGGIIILHTAGCSLQSRRQDRNRVFLRRGGRNRTALHPYCHS